MHTMTRPARTSDHRSNVNVNSVHIPLAVAVWQAPNILRAVASIGFGSILFIVAATIFSYPLSKTPALNEKTRAKNDYYEWCYSTTRVERPDLSSTAVFRYCRSAAGFAP